MVSRSPAFGRVLVPLLLFLSIHFVSGDPTACDGNDSTVPNCCSGVGQKCDACKAGFGLVKNTCQKCKNPKCARCNGDTTTCKTSDMYRTIPNCSYADWTSCIECEDGYTLANSGMECRRCSIKNCGSCSKDGKKCLKCAYGYGTDKKTKQCVKCTQENCLECYNDATVCTSCGFKGSVSYSVSNGKCVACPSGVSECGNSKAVACQGGYYLDKDTSTCKKCASGCNECTSATTCTYCGFGYERSNAGECVKCPQNAATCIDKLTCSYGYFPMGATSCQKCPSNLLCQTCESTTKCASCFPDRVLTSDGKCIPKASSDFESEAAPTAVGSDATSYNMIGMGVGAVLLPFL